MESNLLQRLHVVYAMLICNGEVLENDCSSAEFGCFELLWAEKSSV